MVIVPFSLKNCNQKYFTLPSLRCREQQVCPKQEKIYIQDCSKSDLKIQDCRLYTLKLGFGDKFCPCHILNASSIKTPIQRGLKMMCNSEITS